MYAEMLIQIFHVTTVFMVALATAICAYHLLLALVSFVPSQHSRKAHATKMHRFAVLIPAHNEQDVLEASLVSCSRLNYPRDKHRVYVVADNCTDATADVALRNGAVCLERTEDTRRGKGYALEWAIPQILADEVDAVLVLDADCTVDSDALLVLDGCFGEGMRAVQLDNIVSNPDESSLAYLLGLANYLENRSFYAPKSRIGFFAPLRGTGMAIHSDVLCSVPWRCGGLSEDMEYSLQLLINGVRVHHICEAGVASQCPTGGEQLSVQRRRWIRGSLNAGKTACRRLATAAFCRGRWIALDAMWSILVIQRSFVIAQFAAALALAAFYGRIVNDSSIALLWMLGVGIGNALYVAQGIIRFGINRPRLEFIAMIPLQAAQYLTLAMNAFLTARPRDWCRTPRSPADINHSDA